MGISDIIEPITLYRVGNFSFQKKGDLFQTIHHDWVIQWIPIDDQIRHSMQWIRNCSEGSPIVKIARFVQEYVGEEHWALIALETL